MFAFISGELAMRQQQPGMTTEPEMCRFHRKTSRKGGKYFQYDSNQHSLSFIRINI